MRISELTDSEMVEAGFVKAKVVHTVVNISQPDLFQSPQGKFAASETLRVFYHLATAAAYVIFTSGECLAFPPSTVKFVRL